MSDINNLAFSAISNLQNSTEEARVSKPDCTWIRFMKRAQNKITGEWFDAFKPIFLTKIFTSEESKKVALVLRTAKHEQDYENIVAPFLVKALDYASKALGGREVPEARQAYVLARRVEGMVKSTNMRVPPMQLWCRVDGESTRLA